MTADGELRAIHTTVFDHHQALTTPRYHRGMNALKAAPMLLRPFQTTQEANFARVTPNRTDISVSLLKHPMNADATWG
jgi:hypothetical protein